MRHRWDRVIGFRSEAVGLKFSGWRPIFLTAAAVAMMGAVVYEAWLLMLPAFLLLCAVALWRHHLRPETDSAAPLKVIKEADQTHVLTSAGTLAGGFDENRRAQMGRIVDQVLRRHPHSPEARLVKASMLWHFNGDRDGARCHCRDILGRIQREDPLFDQVCDLYLRTCAPTLSRSRPPAFNLAADASRPDRSAVSGLKQAKIIPLSSKRPPQVAAQ